MTTIDRILAKATDGTRITSDECLALFACRDLHKLGRAAHAVTARLHPEPYRTFNIDRNVNYTNVCAAVCDFCAFYRKSADADAYVLPREELYQKIEETIALRGDQILMQGGNHPSLKLEWDEELLRDLRGRFPQVNLHAVRASRGVRVFAYPGHRPAVPRQRRQRAVVVGDAGAEDRPAGVVVRGERHGQPDDRGERRQLGGHGISPVARADQGRHPRVGLRAQ